MLTPSTDCVTVTLICPCRLDPSVAFAVIVAVPFETAVTFPFASTLAIFGLFELKETS